MSVSVVPAAAPRPLVEKGIGRWIRSYRMMMGFDVRGLGQWLVIGLVVQVLMGAGAALMYGFYLGDVPEMVRLFIAFAPRLDGVSAHRA